MEPDSSVLEPEDNEPSEIKGEFFTLAGGAAVGQLAVVLTKEAYKALKRSRMEVRVIESIVKGGSCRVKFNLVNQTIHGAYLEEVGLGGDPHIFLQEVSLTEGAIGPVLSDSVRQASPPRFPPQYIEPEKSIYFYVFVSHSPMKEANFPASAKLQLTISVLNQKDPETLEVWFRLRWQQGSAKHGPRSDA